MKDESNTKESSKDFVQRLMYKVNLSPLSSANGNWPSKLTLIISYSNGTSPFFFAGTISINLTYLTCSMANCEDYQRLPDIKTRKSNGKAMSTAWASNDCWSAKLCDTCLQSWGLTFCSRWVRFKIAATTWMIATISVVFRSTPEKWKIVNYHYFRNLGWICQLHQLLSFWIFLGVAKTVTEWYSHWFHHNLHSPQLPTHFMQQWCYGPSRLEFWAE